MGPGHQEGRRDGELSRVSAGAAALPWDSAARALESRSFNIAYVRPIVTLGDPAGLHLTFAPKVFAYVGGQEGNPDIEDYRGHADLRLTGGWRDGLEVSALGRVGDDWDKGSVQVDVTYPLRNLLGGNLDLYLDVQGFYGHGESLLEYRERTSAVRVGVAIVR